MNNKSLFEPIDLGPTHLANRIVMAPLTRNRALDGNVPQANAATYYAQRADAGLIITEATQVCPEGQGYPNTPGIHSAAQIAGWKRVTEAVHAKGGKIFLQLWHVGRISHSSLQPGGKLPVAPSAIAPAGQVYTLQGMKPYETPRALETEELPGIVDSYAQGARNAREAGFDGVEVHGANGYLLDQFLRSVSNKRHDAYGGSIENRARLLLEVTEAVTKIWGADRVGVRISPTQPFNDMHDDTPQETFEYVARQLNRFGLAYLHVLEGTQDVPHDRLAAFDYGRLRAAFAGTYLANCNYDYARAAEALRSGHADLVAFGRLFISNPDLVKRFEIGAALTPPDSSTFYSGGDKGYIDYPALEAA